MLIVPITSSARLPRFLEKETPTAAIEAEQNSDRSGEERDSVELSDASRFRAADAFAPDATRTAPDQRDDRPEGESEGSRLDAEDENDNQASPANPQGLSEEQLQQVEELKRTDREVRAHEAAHQAAAGSLARGKSFSYQTGPDGRRYAVGGEVRIDVSPVANDPEATIQKMQRVRRAALAPAEPSSQDRAVAAQASRTEAQARSELTQIRLEETRAESAEASGESDVSRRDSGSTPRSSAERPDPFVIDQQSAIRRFTDTFSFQTQGVSLNALA